jgi:hypothetical protein
MSVGFSFSAGDFIAALELLTKVVNSLRERGDASTEYQALISQLYSLETALLLYSIKLRLEFAVLNPLRSLVLPARDLNRNQASALIMCRFAHQRPELTLLSGLCRQCTSKSYTCYASRHILELSSHDVDEKF